MKHIKGLNALRAIAAIVVLLSHFDVYFSSPLKLSCFRIYSTNSSASLAVTLFFVISGFLITTLLLNEKEKYHTINIFNFYVRRTLRIWPLYYFIIFLVILYNVMNYDVHLIKMAKYHLLLYFFFLGNFVEPFITIHNLPIIELSPLYVLWSLGVEEQFYIFWPFLIKKIRTKLFLWLTIFIILYLFLKLICQLFFDYKFVLFLNLTRLDIMAIGALGPLILRMNNSIFKKIISILFNKITQIVLWILFISFIFYPFHIFSFIDSELYAFIFLFIILNLAYNSKSILNLENKIFDFLGKISFGIYMYHTLLMMIIKNFVVSLENTLQNYFLYLGIISILTIIISYLSFKYLESIFLKFKTRFNVTH